MHAQTLWFSKGIGEILICNFIPNSGPVRAVFLVSHSEYSAKVALNKVNDTTHPSLKSERKIKSKKTLLNWLTMGATVACLLQRGQNSEVFCHFLELNAQLQCSVVDNKVMGCNAKCYKNKQPWINKCVWKGVCAACPECPRKTQPKWDANPNSLRPKYINQNEMQISIPHVPNIYNKQHK